MVVARSLGEKRWELNVSVWEDEKALETDVLHATELHT